MDDERFKGIATDPRFRPLPSRIRKVKIDDRFKGMFTDKKFKVKCSVDERGRPVKLSSNRHLKKFYQLSSSEEESEEDDEKPVASHVNDGVIEDVHKSEESEDEETGNEAEAEPLAVDQAKVTQSTDKTKKRKKKNKKEEHSKEETEDELNYATERQTREINPMEDYARGVVMMSSSSEDEDDDEFTTPYDQEAHDDHYWGEHDDDAEETDEKTRRLAIQNMDWDRIKAYDLFMLLNSFKPPSGTVHSVKIYPSEFGKEKMKEDDLSGPKELRNSKLDEAGEAEGKIKDLPEKDQKKAMLENLRQYQLNRLKYYYAIAEFDSPETAAHIYDQCDSREYLASCTQLDLRFVPEGMEFNEDELKESANHVPDNYEPKFFINPALGQSLVRCTWDENGPDRSGVFNKKYQADDLEQLDMDDYLASDSDKEEETGKPRSKAKERSELLELADSSSGEEDERSIDKYRAILLGGVKTTKEDSDGSVDLEVTWDTGLKDTAEGLVKKKTKAEKAKGLESVFDKQRQRKREKAKQLKEQKKIKEMNVQAFSDDELPEGFNASELVASDDGIKEVRTSKHEKKKKRPKAKSEVLTHEATKEGEGESLNLMVMNDKGDTLSKKHFNMKEIAEYDNMTKSKRKRKLKRNELKDFEDDFKIDVKDERFRAMYSSHLYNIDPSSQDYRKTKAMQAIIDEKQRRIRDSERSIDKPKKRKIDPETSLIINSKNSESNKNISTLVKSIKAKSRLHSKKTRPLNGKG